MNREFDFIDLYYLNDISNPAMNVEPFSLYKDKETASSGADYIRISSEGEIDEVTCTYAKFLEILDTQGIEGLVNV